MIGGFCEARRSKAYQANGLREECLFGVGAESGSIEGSEALSEETKLCLGGNLWLARRIRLREGRLVWLWSLYVLQPKQATLKAQRAASEHEAHSLLLVHLAC